MHSPIRAHAYAYAYCELPTLISRVRICCSLKFCTLSTKFEILLKIGKTLWLLKKLKPPKGGEGGTGAPPPAPRNSLCDIELLSLQNYNAWFNHHISQSALPLPPSGAHGPSASEYFVHNRGFSRMNMRVSEKSTIGFFRVHCINTAYSGLLTPR